jgi:hypothetical protein
MAMRDILPPLDELRVAHNRLLARYFELLSKVSTVPLLYKNLPPRTATNHELDPVIDEKMKPKALGFILRYLVHSHIRVKLDELATAYTQLQHIMNLREIEASEQSEQRRYREFAESGYRTCVELRDSIGSWSAKGAFVAVSSPLVLAIIGLIGKSVFRAPDLVTVVILAASLLYTFFYLASWFRSSFLSKRELFLACSSWKLVTPSGDDCDSVYRAEDKLFKLLGLGKRRELPLDLLAGELGLVLLVVSVVVFIDYEIAGLSWFRSRPDLWLNAGLVIIAVMAAIGLMVGIIVHNVRGLLRRKDER